MSAAIVSCYLTAGLHNRLRSLIVSNAGLHRAVLLYQPLWLHDLKQVATQQGIKCSAAQLVDFLDSQVCNVTAAAGHSSMFPNI